MKMLRRQSLCLVEFLTVALVFHSSNALLLMDPGPQFFENSFDVTWNSSHSDPNSFYLKFCFPNQIPLCIIAASQVSLNAGKAKVKITPPALLPLSHVMCAVEAFESANSATPFAQSPQFSVTVKVDVRPPEKPAPSSSVQIITAIPPANDVTTSGSPSTTSPPFYQPSSNIIPTNSIPVESSSAGTTSPHSDDPQPFITSPLVSGIGTQEASSSMTDGRTYPSLTATAPSKSIETTNPDSATTSFSAQLSSPTHSKPVGAIVGGTVGGLTVICATIVCLYFWRRRRRHHRGKFLDYSSKLPSVARNPTPAETQEWFSRMHGAMSKAEEQSRIIRKDEDEVKQKQSTGIETPTESSELHPVSGGYDGSGSVGLSSYIASWTGSEDSSDTPYPVDSDSVDSLSLPSAQSTSRSAASANDVNDGLAYRDMFWHHTDLEDVSAEEENRTPVAELAMRQRREAEILKQLRFGLDGSQDHVVQAR
ncbi:hypothetical protein Hypma_013650 [Hypsizygus marmoreus]|uniref:Mid2 domain-containing protein n=1 Tax=Hypsizygus marmoreus TaxID=39966 RepID=A0A369JBX2_HYPMA|nr:hypothetical protein Hypma_013650 [Hypsizygus marmoreus]